MSDSNNLSNQLTKLFQLTYSGSTWISFDDASVLTSEDNKKYAVGISRDRDENFTSNGHYEPHMKTSSTIFVAEIDGEGKFTGNSIRINGHSEETHIHSQKYISRMLHLSDNDLLNPQDAFTHISIDINKSDSLPRYSVGYDGTVQGKTSSDYTTIINEYFDVTDRTEFLKATHSKNHHENYKDCKENQIITRICSQFLISDKSDEKYREEESQRKNINQKKEELRERIERGQALRKFVKEDHEELKIFGNGKIRNSVKKILAKIKLPEMIDSVRAEKEQKAKEDLKSRRQWKNVRDFVQHIMDNR